MPSAPATQPPRVSTRPSGWPVRRMPRWTMLAIAAFLAAAVAVALVHKPSTAERASDMRGFLSEVTSDIESCAAGVSESLTALRQVQAAHFSNSSDVSAGVSVAQQGAANCEPANNEQIDDLENYQVPESLDSFGLVNAVAALVAWAVPNAEQVQTDVAQVLSATTPQARSQDETALSAALRKLDAERALVERPVNSAIKSLAVRSAALRLPG
ncbi:MAG TPA: hypothetical protein VME44_17030 [Streptosporangiaceae bacterium]|nr:hypothetical protein [Streptosporangiaceae bacterium]